MTALPHRSKPIRTPPDADDRFDARAARVRSILWRVLGVALVIIALTWSGEASVSSFFSHSSPVLRAVVIYLLVFVVLRFAGKRTLGATTTFDLVILLILSEAVQPALVGEDTSLRTAVLVVCTLVGVDMALGWLKRDSPTVSRWLDDVPTVLIVDGTPDCAAMRRCDVDDSDILEAARHRHGVTRLDDIEMAVLERTGGISIVPVRHICSACGDGRAASRPV